MDISELKDSIESHGGTITYDGYETYGDSKVYHAEAYFEDVDQAPYIEELDEHPDITVDYDWDAIHNGVYYEYFYASVSTQVA